MSVFLKGTRLRVLALAGQELKKQADVLEGSVPRWDTVTKQDTLDEPLCKARILEHSKRPLVKPLVSFLKATRKRCTAMEKDWKLPPQLDQSTLNFIDATAESGGQYLMVAAAINTIVHFKRAARASTMAEEVLEIARSCGFGFPTCVHEALSKMSKGMPDDGGGGAARPNPHSGAEASAECPAPLSSSASTAAGLPGSSSSSSSSALLAAALEPASLLTVKREFVQESPKHEPEGLDGQPKKRARPARPRQGGGRGQAARPASGI
jgi:hypothetical protein